MRTSLVKRVESEAFLQFGSWVLKAKSLGKEEGGREEGVSHVCCSVPYGTV